MSRNAFNWNANRKKKTSFIFHEGKVISAYIKCLYETLHFTSISVFSNFILNLLNPYLTLLVINMACRDNVNCLECLLLFCISSGKACMYCA